MRTVSDTVHEPRLGISAGQDSSGAIVIRAVQPGGTAEEAGIRTGDVLLALGDLAVTDPGFGEAFRTKFGKNEGDSLPIRIRRGTDTLTLHGKVRLASRVESGIEANPAAGEKALRIRTGIVAGKTE